MMRNFTPTLLAFLLSGCAATVRVERLPIPAVDLPATSVAIVSASRDCGEVADLLAARLSTVPGLSIDPLSPVRLQLDECGRSFESTVYLDQVVDGISGESRAQTSVATRSRSFAHVTVFEDRHVVARLLGSSRESSTDDVDGASSWARSQRRQQRSLADALAEDLVLQISPLPSIAERRVHPNAAEGSARDMHNRAVAAELAGQLDEALHWARAALAEHPSEGLARYVEELSRRTSSR